MTPSQKIQLIPRGLVRAHDFSAGRDRRLEGDPAGVSRSEGEDDPSHGQRDDERVEPENPDQDAVREPDEQTQAEAGQDAESEPLVGMRPRRPG